MVDHQILAIRRQARNRYTRYMESAANRTRRNAQSGMRNFRHKVVKAMNKNEEELFEQFVVTKRLLRTAMGNTTYDLLSPASLVEKLFLTSVVNAQAATSIRIRRTNIIDTEETVDYPSICAGVRENPGLPNMRHRISERMEPKLYDGVVHQKMSKLVRGRRRQEP